MLLELEPAEVLPTTAFLTLDAAFDAAPDTFDAAPVTVDAAPERAFDMLDKNEPEGAEAEGARLIY